MKELIKEVREENHPKYTMYTVGIRDNEIFAEMKYYNDYDENKRKIEYKLLTERAEIRHWEEDELVMECSSSVVWNKEFIRDIKAEIEEVEETNILRVYNFIKDTVEEACEGC